MPTTLRPQPSIVVNGEVVICGRNFQGVDGLTSASNYTARQLAES
ncbi:MAG: hypothetical protein OXD01_14715 [Gammaproteobacteria bacterium]|nr:hypothetical protein [Gammaproteobacteria bacterium]